MKRFSTLFLLLLVCTLMTAGNIGRRAAQRKAAALFGPSTTMKLATVASGNNPAYYVFNAQRAKKGFVIVAGEEQVSDDILGYSESGEFDPQDMPPALQYMLQCYAEQTEMVRNGEAEAHRTTVQRENIDPLVQTKWDQNAPYNLGNEKCILDDVIYPYAGCVATAMAQIIRYYASPVQTTVIPAYSYFLSSDGTNVRSATAAGYYQIDIPALPATTFNYDIMEDYYETSATGESIQEVAKLMAYCGRAAQMKYSKVAGTATERVQYFTYFGFNPNGEEKERADYNATDWDNLVYAELAAKRPVLYSGGAQSAVSNAGHAFVCDGYKDGLFHINWGWSGRYNGFFKLSECNPHGTGSGGSSSKNGYSLRQAVLIGLQPNTTEAAPIRMSTASLVVTNTPSRSSSSANFSIDLAYGTYNLSGRTATFDYGVGIYQNNQLTQDFKRTTTSSLTNGQGYKNATQTIEWGAGITSGTYLLKIISREVETSAWLPNATYLKPLFLTLTVNDNNLSIVEATSSLQANNVNFEGIMKQGKNITLHTNVTNTGTTYTSKLYLFVSGKLATGIGVNLDPGESDNLSLTFSSAQSGTIPLALYTDIDDNFNAVGTAIWTGNIQLAEQREPNLECTKDLIVGQQIENSQRVVYGTTFTAKFTIKNKDSQPFEDELLLYLFKLNNDGTNMGKNVMNKYVAVNIPVGESRDIEVSFDELMFNEKYWVAVYYYKPSTQQNVQLQQTYSAFMRDNSLGITGISADQQVEAPVFNLNGQRIQKPQKGIYIMNGRKYLAR